MGHAVRDDRVAVDLVTVQADADAHASGDRRRGQAEFGRWLLGWEKAWMVS